VKENDESLLGLPDKNASLGSCSATAGNSLLVPIFELGLVCSSESPDQRPSMNDVVVCPKNIKKGLLCFHADTVKGGLNVVTSMRLGSMT